MKSITDYRKRFFYLMESEIGDVKPISDDKTKINTSDLNSLWKTMTLDYKFYDYNYLKDIAERQRKELKRPDFLENVNLFRGLNGKEFIYVEDPDEENPIFINLKHNMDLSQKYLFVYLLDDGNLIFRYPNGSKNTISTIGKNIDQIKSEIQLILK